MPENEVPNIPDFWAEKDKQTAANAAARQQAEDEVGYMQATIDVKEPEPAPFNPVIPKVEMPFVGPDGTTPVDKHGKPTETALERALRTNKV